MHNRRYRRLIAAATVLASAAVLTACSSQVSTSPPPASSAQPEVAVEELVSQWVAAWESGDAEGMAELFTEDGVYVDNAFSAEQVGQEQVAQWVQLTHQGFADADAEVHDVIASAEGIAISWTFSAHMRGAPSAFSVPATTHMELDGGLIERNTDTYNLADLLRQSGLPAEYTPGT
ncbi:SgcJ/EcaC family oxidoreductase [Arenivirga flava]|uniref:SnoaL-like domain-containing protein n=1 Tax=Arenivirga flava TaxID=1930060 RepID=A0AA37XBM7_9MICO|nr:SgcJ/EcaC family oxidoreductase [Arenivirga flava]GMA28861.1 hypothetical protein GCM10025874_21140 [Arenivirga flava]